MKDFFIKIASSKTFFVILRQINNFKVNLEELSKILDHRHSVK